MKQIALYLADWHKRTDSLEKLQGTYGALAIAMLLIAGLISLINPNLGQSMLFFAIVLGLTFIGNGVVWALVRTFVIPTIEKHTPKTRKK